MKTENLPGLMETYHEFFHLAFGLLSFIAVGILFPESGLFSLLFLAIIASFLPDIDHLFFIFVYGANTEYSRFLNLLIKQGHVRDAVAFIRTNHKSNQFILSHNFLSPSISVVLFGYFISQQQPLLAVFFLSWSMHYVFDVVEDLMSLGKINSNWYFKFSRN